jgi:hypothetical protein
MNSTGSSIVMMWPRLFSLRCPIIAASVVDLPEPVPPTTKHKPRFVIATSLSCPGRSRSSNDGIFVTIVRMTAPTWPCWTNALTRNRPMPCGAMAKLHSFVASNSFACLSFMIERTISELCAEVSGRSANGRIVPSILIAGGKSLVMKRSEPLFSTIFFSKFCVSRTA